MTARSAPGKPPSWWTVADQAERDLLVWELVRECFDHRARCEECQGGQSCTGFREALRVAVDAILDWRVGRMARSRASFLREQQNLLDEEVLPRG